MVLGQLQAEAAERAIDHGAELGRAVSQDQQGRGEQGLARMRPALVGRGLRLGDITVGGGEFRSAHVSPSRRRYYRGGLTQRLSYRESDLRPRQPAGRTCRRITSRGGKAPLVRLQPQLEIGGLAAGGMADHGDLVDLAVLELEPAVAGAEGLGGGLAVGAEIAPERGSALAQGGE